MKNKPSFFITLDYELALGKDSGTVEKCILMPTHIILELLKIYKGSALFFIDTSYLLKLKETDHKDFDKIKNQIIEIIKSGNDIGLHLHPQWLDAYPIDQKRWGFNSFDHYKLHSLVESQITDLFKEGLELLNNIITELKVDYKISAFRAGGWCIQPFDKLKNAFLETGIKYDFSVNPGLVNTFKDKSYDFTNAPKNTAYWQFENDPCKNENGGAFVEVPVSTFKIMNMDNWISYYGTIKKNKTFNDGKSINDVNVGESKLAKIKSLFHKKYFALTIDGLSYFYYKRAAKKLSKKINILTTICHPKNLSKNGIKIIEYILKSYKTINLKDLEK